MPVDLVLTNAKAYFKGEIVECSLAVEDGKIRKIGREPSMPSADEKTDLKGNLVLPGVIDSHAHLRDEENAYKETFQSGTAAAAEGGVTTVLDMPNNKPVTMSAEALRTRISIAERRVLVNVGFFSEFPTSLDEVKAINSEGAVGFKLFMAEQVGGLNIDDDEALLGAFAKASEAGLPIAVHAEEHALLKQAVNEFKLNRRDDIKAFLKAHDEVIELAAVDHLLHLTASLENSRVHICHISTQKALAAIKEAKKSGKAITCEATPHHLALTTDVYEQLGTLALTMPPLRTKENVDALWRGIEDGTVDTIGDDHAPHSIEEKQLRSVWDAKSGIPGLETTLPIVLTMVHRGKLTLERVVELMSERPAEIFDLADKGRLLQDYAADIVVVDFNRKHHIDASRFKSKAKFSPFDKWEVQGKPWKTYVNGQLIMDDGEIVAKAGNGRVIRRAPK